MADHPLAGGPADQFLEFVEEAGFSQDWEVLGLNDETDLWDLQIEIMEAPTGHPVIRGSGGVRKMRFSPRSWNIGSRGAVRVIYGYFPECQIVLLIAAYRKSARDNITPAERNAMRAYMTEASRLLRKERDRG